MSQSRDKSLRHFVSVLEWIRSNGFDQTTVIGGIAVGAYVPEERAASLSADLDLLTIQQELRRIGEEAPRLAGVRVVKRPQAGTLPVLVIDWNGLEINILTSSPGLPDARELRKRAWPIAGYPVADPVDLLSNKLETAKIESRKDRDRAHIEILRDVCMVLSLHFFESGKGRRSIDFLQRWEKVATKNALAPLLIPELLARASETNRRGRRLLMRWLCIGNDTDRINKLVAIAPPTEREDLLAIRESQETSHDSSRTSRR